MASTEDGRRRTEDGGRRDADASRRADRIRDVDLVLAHHKTLQPRARHDKKSRTAVERGLGLGFEVGELCTALDGAHRDEWCRRTGNTGPRYVFQDAETIGKYQIKGEVAAAPSAKPADLPALLAAVVVEHALAGYDGNADAYRAKLDKAKADPRIRDTLGAVTALERIQPWTLTADQWLAKTIRERLAGVAA